jgi:DNA-binding transcriptional regulator YbjK
MRKPTDGRLARGRASRTLILAAAVRVVAAQGVAALTHRAVAVTAGVSHALVTYHFSTAADLAKAALAHSGGQLAGHLGRLFAARPDPDDVPRVAADVAAAMVTELRDETITLYELMAASTRNPELQPSVAAVVDAIADVVEPLSGSRDLATTAASALLGSVLTTMASGQDHEADALRRRVTVMVEHFDPRRQGR